MLTNHPCPNLAARQHNRYILWNGLHHHAAKTSGKGREPVAGFDGYILQGAELPMIVEPEDLLEPEDKPKNLLEPES